jgi:hypothetical protein
MGIIRNPIPVKLFVGMLSPDPSLFDTCAELLCKECGPIDYQSEVLPWGKANYYREEMGDGIVRKFVFFDRLIDPVSMPEIKIFTNRVENIYSLQAENVVRRRINLDPGYVTEAKVVLATTKDFSHRIYIGRGMYAEVTLRYSNAKKSFTAFDYTYPDYRTDEYTTLFNNARDRLRAALNRTIPKEARRLMIDQAMGEEIVSEND